MMGRTFLYKLVFKALGTGTCILLMMASWLTMAEFLQSFEDTFDKQIFLVYFVQSFSTILYIAWKIWIMFPGGYSCNRAGEGKLDNFKKLLIVVIVLFVIGTPVNIFWYISLTMTRISANTAIYQSTPALVFVISIPILRERVTLTKILSVALTVVGVCLVSIYRDNILDDDDDKQRANITGLKITEDDDEEFESPLGYALVILSVLLYAVYQTLYKKLASKEDDTAPVWNVIRILGYTGVLTLFFFWPVLIIAHFSGLETFEFPPTWRVFFEIIGVCVLDSTFNISLLVCISISSPLFASVASILTVPVAVLLDWWLKDFILSWQALIGVGGVLLGFVGLTMSEIRETKLKTVEEIEDTKKLISEDPRLSTEKEDSIALEDSKNTTGEKESLLPKEPNKTASAKIQLRDKIKLRKVGAYLVEHIV